MKFNKSNLPLIISLLVFLIVLLMWFFPGLLGLVDEIYTVDKYRSDLKDLAGLFYIVVTLWLVLVTRKMAETSINSQKAMNRPEIVSELFISNEKPSKSHFSGINNVEVRSSPDGYYIENQEGASVFLVIKNRYGGGKTINVSIESTFIVKNPDNSKLERNLEIDFLAEGDAVAFYLYRFEKPSTESCELNLDRCILAYTDPFADASREKPKELKYSKDKPILATGNHIGLIRLRSGIRISE